MIMEKVAKQQICFKLCSNFSTFIPIIVLLVLFSFFFFFSISKFSPSLLTILIAVLSTIFLITLTRKKGPPNENLVQDNLHECQLQPSLDVTHTDVTKESETSQRHDNDDDDDENSLIEIKLPSSYFSGLTEDEEPKQKLESNLPVFLQESIFKQQDLLELLADINEDENLIEIDIFMGSTKCQDLRLKQELVYFGDQCVPND